MEHLSDKAFGDALRTLMDERSLSYRSLAEATRQLDGKGMTHAHINMLANGHDKPSMRAMELIAKACDYPASLLRRISAGRGYARARPV